MFLPAMLFDAGVHQNAHIGNKITVQITVICDCSLKSRAAREDLNKADLG